MQSIIVYKERPTDGAPCTTTTKKMNKDKKYHKGTIHRFLVDNEQIKARGECQSYVNLYKDDLFRLYNAFPGILREYLMQKGYM